MIRSQVIIDKEFNNVTVYIVYPDYGPKCPVFECSPKSHDFTTWMPDTHTVRYSDESRIQVFNIQTVTVLSVQNTRTKLRHFFLHPTPDFCDTWGRFLDCKSWAVRRSPNISASNLGEKVGRQRTAQLNRAISMKFSLSSTFKKSTPGVNFSIVKVERFAVRPPFSQLFVAQNLGVGERRNWIDRFLWRSLSKKRTRNRPLMWNV